MAIERKPSQISDAKIFPIIVIIYRLLSSLAILSVTIMFFFKFSYKDLHSSNNQFSIIPVELVFYFMSWEYVQRLVMFIS